MSYLFRAELGDRERLVMHLAHHFGVPVEIVGHFYKTSKVHRLRKMFWRHHKEALKLGGYNSAWDQVLTADEKAAFQPYKGERK